MNDESKNNYTNEKTVLTPDDYEAFFDALDNPPEPTEKLKEAFKRYKQYVVSD